MGPRRWPATDEGELVGTPLHKRSDSPRHGELAHSCDGVLMSSPQSAAVQKLPSSLCVSAWRDARIDGIEHLGTQGGYE